MSILLVVGGACDVEVRSAVARWGPLRAAILDAGDLSRPGWRLHSGDPGGGMVMAGGRVLPVSDISAVLVRRQAVYPQELAHVHADDRDYVASEMTALLAWWLSVLPVPVLNRPGGAVLCGPGWRSEQWLALAGRLGFPVARWRRSTGAPEIASPVAFSLVAVGDQVLGAAPPGLSACLLALARAARIPLLTAAFDENGALLNAHPFPPVTAELLAAVELAGRSAEPEIRTRENFPGFFAAPRLVEGRL